ncbi:MAG: tRNA (N6-isopentenyl adenosine(37)-C2)-methylthiotransferase MiaB [Treponema sp.]|nr:tRNA (N6-isopentenyl adenosine(37)-C2)-methylthiotransferase MiaB [Treponema sp.]
MTYFFETYGCEMNKAESASIEHLFINRNWKAAKNAQEAKFVVINTCSVRATAETRILGRLGWYTALRRQRQDSFVLVVTGCMAERLKDDFKKNFPVIDYVVGTFQKQSFLDIIDAIEQNRKLEKIDEEPIYTFAPLSYEIGEFRAYVPIMHGCNNFCTYCIVPYVRGREVSRSPKEILEELSQLSYHKVKEVTLLGQNVNSYRFNDDDGNEIDFPILMKMIANHLKNIKSSIGWIRFMSSHPKDLSEKLIDVIAEEKIFCRHIHLPVQHGSSKILEAMNRKYTREQYLDLVKMIRKKIPEITLTTDVMVGFPGETEEDFEKTVSLFNEVSYESAFMYYFNPREGTKAFSMTNQIPMKTKKARLSKIIDLQLKNTKTEMQKRIGNIVTVLVETISRDNKNELLGRTEKNAHVVFEADSSLIGNFVKVQLKELNGNTFRGIIVKE